ncbi:hypothetical protein ACWKWF_15895, partial [Acinetobacter kookii]
LHVGETAIRITRAAKPKRKDDSGQRVAPQPGEAIAARLIVAVVKDAQDKTVARWSLISNVPSEIDAVELTTWYYWRATLVAEDVVVVVMTTMKMKIAVAALVAEDVVAAVMRMMMMMIAEAALVAEEVGEEKKNKMRIMGWGGGVGGGVGD